MLFREQMGDRPSDRSNCTLPRLMGLSRMGVRKLEESFEHLGNLDIRVKCSVGWRDQSLFRLAEESLCWLEQVAVCWSSA